MRLFATLESEITDEQAYAKYGFLHGDSERNWKKGAIKNRDRRRERRRRYRLREPEKRTHARTRSRAQDAGERTFRRVARARDVKFAGLLLITRSVVGSFCELLEVMLY